MKNKKCKDCYFIKHDIKRKGHYLCDYKDIKSNNSKFKTPDRITKRARKLDFACKNFKTWVDITNLK